MEGEVESILIRYSKRRELPSDIWVIFGESIDPYYSLQSPCLVVFIFYTQLGSRDGDGFD